MKIKYIMAMVAVALMTVGCNSIDEAQLMGPVPIKLTASVGVEAVTRGADGKIIETDATITRGIQENALTTDETVYVWANEQGGSTWDYLKAWTLTNASTGLTGSTQYYPADGTSITMNAVHGNFAETLTEGTTAISSLTHSVLADQSAEKGYEKSDLLFGTATGSKASTSAENIGFTHKLSKIEVNLSAGYGYVDTDLSDAQVHLNNVKPSVTINAADGTLGTATGDAVTITTRKNASTGTFEAVIPPQTFTNPDALIAVTTTNGDLTLTSTVPNDVATYASDTRYVYNVNCSKTNKRLNPLWYVAENNVQSFNSATKMVTLETDPTTAGASQVYSWDDAMAYFSKQSSSYDEYWAGDITDGSSSFYYHLPCQKEIFSVIPTNDNVFSTSIFMAGGGKVSSAQTCIFGYSSDTKNGVDDWSYWSSYTENSCVRYAIRFLGTPYCSVWKYQFDTSNHVFLVTAKLIDYLTADADATTLSSLLSTYIAKSDSWWNSNDEDEGAIQRKFYAVGYRSNSNNGGSGTADANIGTDGYYRSTKEQIPESGTSIRGTTFRFNKSWFCAYPSDSKAYGFSVRLFRNTGVSEARIDPGIPLSEITSSHLGMVIASNGKIYTKRAVADLFSEGVAVICYIGSATGNSTYNHGMAFALTDAPCTSDAFYWTTSATKTVNGSGYQFTTKGSFGTEDGSRYGTSFNKNAMNRNNSTYPAFQAAINYPKTPPSNSTGWFLPSAYQFTTMANAVGGYTTLRTYAYDNDRGGNAFYNSFYWTCTEYNATRAWDYRFPDYDATWSNNPKEGGYWVRPMFAF